MILGIKQSELQICSVGWPRGWLTPAAITNRLSKRFIFVAEFFRRRFIAEVDVYQVRTGDKAYASVLGAQEIVEWFLLWRCHPCAAPRRVRQLAGRGWSALFLTARPQVGWVGLNSTVNDNDNSSDCLFYFSLLVCLLEHGKKCLVKVRHRLALTVVGRRMRRKTRCDKIRFQMNVKLGSAKGEGSSSPEN